MPTKQCQGEKDDGKDKDDNFSVATISMSIATDFDSASIKSGSILSRFPDRRLNHKIAIKRKKSIEILCLSD